MISGRGIEYSKLAPKPLPPAITKVGAENPGEQFTKMVSPPPFHLINQSSVNDYRTRAVLKESPWIAVHDLIPKTHG